MEFGFVSFSSAQLRQNQELESFPKQNAQRSRNVEAEAWNPDN